MKGTDAAESGGGNDRRFDEPPAGSTAVSAHQSSPERVVFTEDGNYDGWIAIDADLATRIHR